MSATAIYLYEGYMNYFQRNLPTTILDKFGGMIGVTAYLADVADEVDDRINCFPPGMDYPGVLEYEVVELLGEWLADKFEPTPEAAGDMFVTVVRLWSKGGHDWMDLLKLPGSEKLRV